MGNYEPNINIKAWAEEDRPREKISRLGRRSLSDAELLSILIRAGHRNESAVELSKRILYSCENDLNLLSKLAVSDFLKFKGMGETKAVSIIAALELGRRRNESPAQKRIQIRTSMEVYDSLKAYFQDLNHEEFWIVLLNRANFVLSVKLISKGGQTGTIADPKIIFNTALENHAASIILAHNHPSGNLKPSASDLDLTKKLVMAGRLLDMPVLDHLIIADQGFFSFADEGMMEF